MAGVATFLYWVQLDARWVLMVLQSKQGKCSCKHPRRHLWNR
jgi:hypothetical protein